MERNYGEPALIEQTDCAASPVEPFGWERSNRRVRALELAVQIGFTDPVCILAAARQFVAFLEEG
jgi:hypothetical protein